jgi:protoporphyrinogen oxidase
VSRQRTALIIGAGPAGLTAAYELLTRTDIRPLVIERSDYFGGIARTVAYKGNRIDIGGHRFFSKSDRVMQWWLHFLPLQKNADESFRIAYQGQSRTLSGGQGPDPDREDRVMLVRSRKSRIYYLRQFFDYPISLSPDTVRKLGLWRTIKIGFSYLRVVLFPVRPEKNLEEFFINRFGRELYRTFFKDYTEKVWGVSCREISAEWGAQRIKGLSILRAVAHFAKKLFAGKSDLSQKATETSLIERFLYPKLGPGQMWEVVAEEVRRLGGEIRMRQEIVNLEHEGGRIVAATVRDAASGNVARLEADFFFSTMPIQNLVAGLQPPAPPAAREVAAGLVYRDFLTVGLLCRRLAISEVAAGGGTRPVTDNWIYIQEPDVKVGRLQIFNNWSPYMVADPHTMWIGLEYFCNEGDALWSLSDAELVELGKEEMERIGIVSRSDVLDGVVLRMEKTYPAYFGSYQRFGELRSYLDGFENLFLVGRNGMHRYNNQDHSMLAAMTAVDNLIEGRSDKANIWDVNTEEEYHEEKRGGT